MKMRLFKNFSHELSVVNQTIKVSSSSIVVVVVVICLAPNIGFLTELQPLSFTNPLSIDTQQVFQK